MAVGELERAQGTGVEISFSAPRMTGLGLVSRVSSVQTAMRNCTRDEGRSFEVGNQVLISRTTAFISASTLAMLNRNQQT
jgi:hypothetical protein